MLWLSGSEKVPISARPSCGRRTGRRAQHGGHQRPQAARRPCQPPCFADRAQVMFLHIAFPFQNKSPPLLRREARGNSGRTAYIAILLCKDVRFRHYITILLQSGRSCRYLLGSADNDIDRSLLFGPSEQADASTKRHAPTKRAAVARASGFILRPDAPCTAASAEAPRRLRWRMALRLCALRLPPPLRSARTVTRRRRPPARSPPARARPVCRPAVVRRPAAPAAAAPRRGRWRARTASRRSPAA